MTRVLGAIAAVLMSGAVLAPHGESSPQPPDLSGHWVLVEALVEGTTRSSSAPATTTGTGGAPTSLNTVSGAAFNCGRECTITQTGGTLTVAEAQLADYAGKDRTRQTPLVALPLDGREHTVIDSFNPHLELSVVAGWRDDTLHIDSRRARTAKRQIVSLDGARLVVVSIAYLNGVQRSAVTFRYEKRLPPVTGGERSNR
jgi:hypothetical protein